MEKAILIKVDGTKQTVKPNNGRDFKFYELSDMLDCELVQVLGNNSNADNINLVCDEEGKFNTPDAINVDATLLAHEYYLINSDEYLVGNVLFCNAKQIR